jgi:hypothetical protein
VRIQELEKLHYGRVAATGWLFLIGLVASLWATGSVSWETIQGVLATDRGSLVLAIATAIAGLGGPPALGLLLDRLAALILISMKANMWYLPFNDRFGENLRSEVNSIGDVESAGAFQSFFYSYADSRLIDWMRRRTTQVYGSVTAAMALMSSLFTAWFLGALSPTVSVVSLLLIAGLVAYSVLVTKAISETGRAWVSTIGKVVIGEYRQRMEAASNFGGEHEATDLAPSPNNAATANHASRGR